MNVLSGTSLFSTLPFLLSQKRQLLPFFLLPAQGLCSRDVDQDAWALRYCVSLGMELLCAQSFSCNFSLYGKSKRRNTAAYLYFLKKNFFFLKSNTMHSLEDSNDFFPKFNFFPKFKGLQDQLYPLDREAMTCNENFSMESLPVYCNFTFKFYIQ